VISQLNNFLTELEWRGDASTEAIGGQFELKGVAPQKSYIVHFIDPKRRIGATATLKTGDATPTVVLKTCGQATARFVDSEGQPVAGSRRSLHIVITPGTNKYDFRAMDGGKFAADSDFVSNIDRLNYWNLPPTDSDGRITFPALIPGATYRIDGYEKGMITIGKEFHVDAKETLDLGEIDIKEHN
jgi:hypothetical protein